MLVLLRATGRTMAVLSILMGGAAVADVWFVDSDSSASSPDGTSWSSAFNTIQAGVDAAYAGGGGEVWVAAGTYTATTDTIVTMQDGVSVYGGFTGGETARSQRDWNANRTVVDGEHKRRGFITADNVTLDGFIVIHGYPFKYGPGSGGGLYSSSSPVEINNCIFAENTAASGGGVYTISPALTLTNCTFVGNEKAGLISDGGAPVLSGCLFIGNHCNYGGGAMFCTSSPTLINCIFMNNRARLSGGAIYSYNHSTPTIVNTTFVSNSAIVAGGGV